MNTRPQFFAATLLACAVTASGCRKSEEPAKRDAPETTTKVEPERRAPETTTKPVTTTPSTPAKNKDDTSMTTATAATSPLISKSHTLTLKGKELAAAGKLPTDLKAATFAAGCFWGVEDTFRAVPGVIATSAGFSGGKTASPTYRQVCEHGTGHAEAVDVVYDASVVSYEKLLDVFFTNHNPTQVNRQGPDFGDQYRTAIFYHDDAQKAAADKAKTDLAKSGKWNQPIATQIVKFDKFWPAEDYHQVYHEKNGGTCH
ncbi:MAG: peptide-methionine (S)-S-oxide reductase MsrA [Phycisphaerales bacterium]